MLASRIDRVETLLVCSSHPEVEQILNNEIGAKVCPSVDSVLDSACSLGQLREPEMELSPPGTRSKVKKEELPEQFYCINRSLNFDIYEAGIDVETQTYDGIVDDLYADVRTQSAAGTSIACQTDVASEDERRLASLKGEWLPLCEDTLQLNAVVEVRAPIVSGDAQPIRLQKGLRGCVQTIDSDGDAIVYFPHLVEDGIFKQVCVFTQDFKKLSYLPS